MMKNRTPRLSARRFSKPGAMGRLNNKIRWVFLALLLCLLSVIFMTKDQRYVAVPALACGLLVFLLWAVLWERDREPPLFDTGLICALATFVYTVYPLVNYWSDGLEFGPLSDLRLQAYNISPQQLGAFHLRHILYLACFVLAYLAFRGNGTLRTGNVRVINKAGRHVIIVGFLLLTAYFPLLQFLTGFNLNTGYAPDAYAENLAILEKLPLLLLQISF